MTAEPTGIVDLLGKLQETVDRIRLERGPQPSPTTEPIPEPIGALAIHEVIGYDLSEVEDALADLDTDTKLLKELEDFDTALVLAAAADALVAEAKRIAGTFHDRAWALRGDVYGDHHHPELGVVSVRRTAKSTKWDHDATAARVVDKHMEQRGYEVPDDPAEVMRWLLEAGAVNYWRVGVLKELGIDADDEELRWKESGNPSISFPSIKK